MEINGVEKYITLDISLNFCSLNKIKITSSEPKYYFVRSSKRLITSIGLKTTVRPKSIKKARFAITEVSFKYLSKIIKEFKDVPYEGYVRKRSKQMTTDSYFYLDIQLSTCMMRNLCG